MNAITSNKFGALAAKFANQTADDLGTGIQTGFGLIGYKGKTWSIRFRGENTPIMRADKTGPEPSIEVVIVKASSMISKIWYENAYVEGANLPPDCFSTNGIVPDLTANKKQNDSCANCPQNQWGSKITPAGKRAKACQDSKRLAVVPLNDLANETMGGPMLLRVPAASLQDLAMYGTRMAQHGYPYNSIATRVSFDIKEAYPKFVFSEIRALSDAEADIVLKHAESTMTARILAESIDQTVIPEPLPGPAFEAAPAASPVPPKQVAAPVASMPTRSAPTVATVGAFGGAASNGQPATPAHKAAAPSAPPQTSNTGDFELNLEAELEKLMPK